MLKHLLQISDLSREQIEQLILRAQYFGINSPNIAPSLLSKKGFLSTLFFENSTRTRASFELAAHTLGIKTINLDINTSSVKKDESMIDTFQTLAAMGCRYFVVRHSESNILEKIVSEHPALSSACHFVNAGDGHHAHPTQGLLDMLTIYQAQKKSEIDFSHLRVGILGDSVHSRVAKSDIVALKLLGCRDIRLIGPDSWLVEPEEYVTSQTNPLNKSVMEDLDVIITLRVQKERMAYLDLALLNDYVEHFQLTSERLKWAKPDAIVMHPGPINRGIEMTSEVADGNQSFILKQVSNGVLMRTAVLEAMSEVRTE